MFSNSYCKKWRFERDEQAHIFHKVDNVGEAGTIAFAESDEEDEEDNDVLDPALLLSNFPPGDPSWLEPSLTDILGPPPGDPLRYALSYRVLDELGPILAR
jgi:hypothetical protein